MGCMSRWPNRSHPRQQTYPKSERKEKKVTIMNQIKSVKGRKKLTSCS